MGRFVHFPLFRLHVQFAVAHTISTDLEYADWTCKWIFLQLSFLVEKFAGFAVCWETIQAVVETVW